MAVLRVQWCFMLCMVLFLSVSALPSELVASRHRHLKKRYTMALHAPASYRFSWGIDNERRSYGSASGQYISRSQIVGSTSVTQKEVNACAASCDDTLRCSFFQLVQMKGGSEGAVVCSLYNTKQFKTDATMSFGTVSSGGSVVASYGFTRSRPVTHIAHSSSEGRQAASSAATRVSSTLSTSTTKTERSQSSKMLIVSTALSTIPDRTITASNRISIISETSSSSSITLASSSDVSDFVPGQSSTALTSSTFVTAFSATATTIPSFRASSSTSNTTLHSATSSAQSRTVSQLWNSSNTESLTLTASTSTGRKKSSKARLTTVSEASSSRTVTASATSSPAAPPRNVTGPPAGARFVQFKGCASSPHTVPMFVSRRYPTGLLFSTASTVWITQHGASRNGDDYFTSVYKVVGDAGVVIAPNFYASTDAPAPYSYYRPDSNLAWRANDWANAADAISPPGVSSCSSFDVYDSLIASLRDRSKFPLLQRIIVVAHSAGSAMMGRYGMISSDVEIKYVLANAPVMSYPTDARPVPQSDCKRIGSFGHGWEGGFPRYVASRSLGGPQNFRDWVSRDITLMTGNLDTFTRDQSGDQTCSALAQGGQNRRDRGYAFWAYINLLAGTDTDVSAYYGYDALKSQVSSLSIPNFKVRHCVVPGVAHDNDGMFFSACGQAAIKGARFLPSGPGPVRPA